MLRSQATLAHWILRIGVAFAFLYPPIAAISDPNSWVGYIPPFLLSVSGLAPLVLLHVIGLFEVLVALWILSGWRIQLPAAVASLFLLAIVYFNSATFGVVFRDLSIAATSLALVFWPRALTADAAPLVQNK